MITEEFEGKGFNAFCFFILKNNRPRCFYRGLMPTENPQSEICFERRRRVGSCLHDPAINGAVTA